MFPIDSKILVAEDNNALREIVVSYLRNLGYQHIVETEDVPQALKALTAATDAKQIFDLIISDWKMPGMSGMDLLNAVRRKPEWADIPFVFLTSESRQDLIIRAVQAGANNYILKPLVEDTLKEKLERTYAQLKKTKA